MFINIRDNMKFISSLLFALAILVGGVFLSSKSVLALGPVETVINQSELLAALADTSVETIIIGDSFDVNQKINITRTVTIDGAGKTITMSGNDPEAWDTATAYVFQVYGASDVVIKDISLTHGNAALLINNSTATLLGTINVSGNGFGGIESSNGSAVLTISGTLTNDSESYGKPTVWEDGVTGTTVDGFTGTKNTTIKTTQVQYYLVAGNSDTALPVIKLLGTTPLSIVQGSSYSDAGATATDDTDTNVEVVSSGSVDTNVVGTYIITYNATDSAGNNAVSITRTVNVYRKNRSGGSSVVKPATTSVPVVTSVVTSTTGQVLGAESFNFTQRLAVKSQGEEVTQLQTLLNAKNFGPLVVDGKFGPLTKGALIKFQVANGLVGDGIVGPLTRAFLNK